MSKIKTIFLTGVLVFSMAFMSACAGKTGDQQEAAVEETAPAAEEAAAPEEPEAQPQPQPQQTQAAANGGKKPADPDDLMAIFEILDRK